MKENLPSFKSRLAACTDRDLRVLITAAADVGEVTPSSLLHWVNDICRWELNRRRRFFHAGAFPSFVATPVARPGFDTDDIDVLLAVRARVAALGEPPLFAALDGLEKLLTDEGTRGMGIRQPPAFR